MYDKTMLSTNQRLLASRTLNNVYHVPCRKALMGLLSIGIKSRPYPLVAALNDSIQYNHFFTFLSVNYHNYSEILAEALL